MKNRIQTLGMVALLPVAVLTFSACSSKCDEPKKTGGEAAGLAMIQPGEAGGIVMGTQKQTATVTGVDKVSRTVTMVTKEGTKIKYKAGPEVRNFNQIEVGDQVNAVVSEQLVVFARKPGTPSGDGAASVLVKAPLGAKPAVMAANTAEVVAKVKAIDVKNQKATLVFPDGTSKTIKARPDVDLTKYAVGDEVVFRATEALAVSVEKP
jgi:hypothetical protein